MLRLFILGSYRQTHLLEAKLTDMLDTQVWSSPTPLDTFHENCVCMESKNSCHTLACIQNLDTSRNHHDESLTSTNKDKTATKISI